MSITKHNTDFEMMYYSCVFSILLQLNYSVLYLISVEILYILQTANFLFRNESW